MAADSSDDGGEVPQTPPIGPRGPPMMNTNGRQLTLDQAYQLGHTYGFRKGEGEGYQSGKAAGKADGIAVGHEKGFDKGLDKGFDKGWDKGKGKGFDNGFNIGKGEATSTTTLEVMFCSVKRKRKLSDIKCID